MHTSALSRHIECLATSIRIQCRSSTVRRVSWLVGIPNRPKSSRLLALARIHIDQFLRKMYGFSKNVFLTLIDHFKLTFEESKFLFLLKSRNLDRSCKKYFITLGSRLDSCLDHTRESLCMILGIPKPIYIDYHLQTIWAWSHGIDKCNSNTLDRNLVDTGSTTRTTS